MSSITTPCGRTMGERGFAFHAGWCKTCAGSKPASNASVSATRKATRRQRIAADNANAVRGPMPRSRGKAQAASKPNAGPDAGDVARNAREALAASRQANAGDVDAGEKLPMNLLDRNGRPLVGAARIAREHALTAQAYREANRSVPAMRFETPETGVVTTPAEPREPERKPEPVSVSATPASTSPEYVTRAEFAALSDTVAKLRLDFRAIMTAIQDADEALDVLAPAA